jgi:O-antigen ligase
MVATYRKSGLLAPVSIILTLAYFRRRELLKLAPFGMVLVVLISALSPGAMGSVVSQFTRADRSKVSTVSDRAADYDAVRPDLFSHFAFGRGWGSYNHESYRILDSEILHRVLEMGVLGLIAFFMLSISVVLATRHVIGSRHPRWSPPALVCAAAAVAFLVVATLYDVLSFPHGTYAFLFLAGVASVVADRGPEPVEAVTESAGSGTRPLRHRRGSPRTGGTSRSRRGADRARA